MAGQLAAGPPVRISTGVGLPNNANYTSLCVTLITERQSEERNSVSCDTGRNNEAPHTGSQIKS
ncbi:hypothetical protein OUZ56_023331 [Daphnia magna]|uniref:Uncharacterized protein n=1 Tax=Daphnia magna TaxID=35525 RepID=A0ABR0AYX4_9CRUS|nr:hypothetical protein OUZ56_023331 [Daphnia magna]